MRLVHRFVPVLLVPIVLACGDDSPTTCCTGSTTSLRVVNAFSSSVDVLVDGNMAGSIAAGTIGSFAPASGTHTIAFRPAGSSTQATQSISITPGTVPTIAAVRASNGSVATASLDDTGSVVPAGATKVRVIHFAPNAGVLQVYRTQPDYQQPISWQFPFTYQPDPNSLSAPFYQSTPGSWEVRIWQTPADASGWADAPVKVVIPLNGGEKKTLLILDKPGGGVQVQLI